MKKDIKEFLHLYLGQKVYINHPDAAFRNDTLDADLLTRLLNGSLPIENYQLILRPLSDMTDEEKRKVVKLLPKSTENILPRIDVGRATSAFMNKATPDLVIYLLSRGFDLFQLIESGLALDKTTLNT